MCIYCEHHDFAHCRLCALSSTNTDMCNVYIGEEFDRVYVEWCRQQQMIPPWLTMPYWSDNMWTMAGERGMVQEMKHNFETHIKPLMPKARVCVALTLNNCWRPCHHTHLHITQSITPIPFFNPLATINVLRSCYDNSHTSFQNICVGSLLIAWMHRNTLWFWIHNNKNKVSTFATIGEKPRLSEGTYTSQEDITFQFWDDFSNATLRVGVTMHLFTLGH